MPCERGADGDFRGFKVADFADHDDIRVLAQNVAQTHGEGQPDFRPDRDLVDAPEFIFDRFLDRDDALLDGVDRAQHRVKRGGFTGTSWTGHKQNAVWFDNNLADGFLVFR